MKVSFSLRGVLLAAGTFKRGGRVRGSDLLRSSSEEGEGLVLHNAQPTQHKKHAGRSLQFGLLIAWEIQFVVPWNERSRGFARKDPTRVDEASFTTYLGKKNFTSVHNGGCRNRGKIPCHRGATLEKTTKAS